MKAGARACAAVVILCLAAGCSHSGSKAPGGTTSAAPSSGSAQAIDPACKVPTHSAAPAPDAASTARVDQVLSRFAARAFNPDAVPARPSTLIGGTYVNYRAQWDGTTDPDANTNILTTGVSDAQSHQSARHDPLNDLLTLRNVDAYLATGARDPALINLRCRLNPITQAEFVSYGVARGWVYQQLVDLSQLDTDGPWSTEARAAAARFAQIFAVPDLLGTTDGKPVRPDWIAESAAALLDAGNRFNMPDWTRLGSDLATALIAKTADPKTGLFPETVLVNPDGTLSVVSNLVKVGAQAQLVDALLTVYDITKLPLHLAAARTALLSLLSPSIGVIDTVGGGWFYAVNSDGSNVRRAYKESRQGWMLPLLEHAAPLIPEAKTYIESTRDVIANKLYQSASQGYPYRVAADFSAFSSKVEGKLVREDWITTEATGIAVSALLGDLKSSAGR